MSLNAAALSDVGRLRPANEDACLARSESRLFAVADGMGGHSAGEVASSLAIDTFGAQPPPTSVDPDALLEFLRARVDLANDVILADATATAEHEGMGTTLTVAAFTTDVAWLVFAHVGDSRLYRLREGQLVQITRDHTWVQNQVDRGLLRADLARAHPMSSMLVRALGTQAAVDIDTGTLQVHVGDVFLICSDGLTNMLPDPDIAGILKQNDTADVLARALVDEANARGGADNITALVIRVLPD